MDSLLFDKEVDPFLEYLEQLPAPTGRRKLSGSLAHCFDIKEGYEELAEWASQAIFLGAVWRAYQPGTVLDEMPIIVGKGWHRQDNLSPASTTSAHTWTLREWP